jgi:hypothetical protein
VSKSRWEQKKFDIVKIIYKLRPKLKLNSKRGIKQNLILRALKSEFIKPGSKHIRK